MHDADLVCDEEAEEAIWTEVIRRYQASQANWMPDVVGRAYGNRGNARSRQGKMQDALADFNESMRLCPWSGEPVLNRSELSCFGLESLPSSIDN